MKKINEDQVNETFFKVYLLDADYSDQQFLSDLNSSNIDLFNFTISENVERDMQNITGSYHIDDVINDYDEIMKLVNDEHGFSMAASGTFGNDKVVVVLYPSYRRVSLVTENPKLEIDDIVKKNVKTVNQSINK